MGSYDGAEVCKLVSLLILNKLTEKHNKDTGLCRDDGLAVFRNMGARSAAKIRKHFLETFNELGPKNNCSDQPQNRNFLDITLDVNSGKYRPYRKPENPLLNINAKFNHPPTIISQLPHSIGGRIARLSCNNEEFDKAAPPYNEALQASGYRSTIQQATAENDSIASQSQNGKKIKGLCELCHPFSPMPAAPSSACPDIFACL